MRVLLCNPDRSLARSPNLGLGYLAASARAAGHEVALLDVCQTGVGDRLVEARLGAGRDDVVGIQAYSCGYDAGRAIARRVKAARASTRVVLGGRHASAAPEDSLRREPAIDFAIAGDAEHAFVRLLSALDGREPLSGVPGLWWRDGESIRGSPPEPGPPLDELPIPAWDLIAPSRYAAAPVGAFLRAAPVAPVVTSRGCTYSCSFCAAPAMGNGIRFRNPDAVADEIELLVRRHGAREIHVLDDNFTLKRGHAVAVCESLLARGLRLPIALPNGVRLDRLDASLVALLERAGVYSMTVGIDSGSQRILDATGRRLTLEQMEAQLRVVKASSRIRLTGNFILGLPGETDDDLEATIAYARRLPLDRANFALYLPLPGSRLHAELSAAGKLDRLDLARLTLRDGVPAFVPDGLSAGALKAAHRRAHLRFYGRWRILLGIAAEVRSVEHAAFLVGKAARAWYGARRAIRPELTAR